MKNSITLLLALLFFASCNTNKSVMSSSWVDEATNPNYKKLAVLVMSPNMNTRATLEEDIVAKMIAHGTAAIPTYDAFPFAGNIGEMQLTEEQIQNAFRQKVKENSIDGLLIITLLDVEQEERYVQGSTFAISAPVYVQDPVYNMPYYGYYSYATGVYQKSYFENTTSYFVESTLHDTKTEKMVYLGHSKTENPDDFDKDLETFSKMLVDDMISKKAI